MCIFNFRKIGVEIRGIKTIVIVLSFLTIIGVGLFYWFEWRPSQARETCVKKAFDSGEGQNWTATEYRFFIDMCLLKRGLEK